MYIFTCDHKHFPKSRDISKLPESGGKKLYVYQLRDEGVEIPFYVGKGSGNRPHRHFTDDAKTVDTAKSRHIRKTLATGIKIYIDILDFFDSKTEAFSYERYLIGKYGRSDNGTGTLYNLTDGGDTGPATTGKKMFRNKITKEISWKTDADPTIWERWSPISGCIAVIKDGRKTFVKKEEAEKDGLERWYSHSRGKRRYVKDGAEIVLSVNEHVPDGYQTLSPVKDRYLVTNGTTNKYIKCGEPIPEGYIKGVVRKTTKGKTCYINAADPTEKLWINVGETPPDGFYHQNKGQVYITDGVIKKKLRNGDDIPPGWYIGSPHKASQGRRYITRGNERKWITVDDPLPEGWEFTTFRKRVEAMPQPSDTPH